MNENTKIKVGKREREREKERERERGFFVGCEVIVVHFSSCFLFFFLVLFLLSPFSFSARSQPKKPTWLNECQTRDIVHQV